MVRQAPVICVMVPPIHLGAWSMALMLWLPFELLFFPSGYNTSFSLPGVGSGARIADNSEVIR